MIKKYFTTIKAKQNQKEERKKNSKNGQLLVVNFGKKATAADEILHNLCDRIFFSFIFISSLLKLYPVVE